jgi:hypothetical protein
MSPLRFLHIPKTAGSTFTQVLMRQYPGKNYFNFTGDIAADLKRFETLSAEEKVDIAFFSGHAPISTGIPEADQTIITFLRDPVSRVRSFCQHVYEGKSPYLLDDFPPEAFSLDDFLNSGIGELSNLQTKMLMNQDHSDTSELLDYISSSDAIHKATRNLLEKIACFGIQEYFDESLILFATKFNWQALYYDPVNRKDASKKLQFKDRHIHRIVELNAIDIKLYKFALERFHQQISSEKFDANRLHKLRLTKFWRDFQRKLDKIQK